MVNEKRFLGRGYVFTPLDSKAKEEAIYIGNLPNRKQVCMYTTDDGIFFPLAYFKTHEKARVALEWLDRLAGIEEHPA